MSQDLARVRDAMSDAKSEAEERQALIDMGIRVTWLFLGPGTMNNPADYGASYRSRNERVNPSGEISLLLQGHVGLWGWDVRPFVAIGGDFYETRRQKPLEKLPVFSLGFDVGVMRIPCFDRVLRFGLTAT